MPAPRPLPDRKQDALRRLADRYTATLPATLRAFATLADRLERGSECPETLTALRRELHRLHGTAASFGYMAAGEMAGTLEAAVTRWTTGSRDGEDAPATRAQHVRRFVAALEAAIAAPSSAGGVASPPGRAAPLMLVRATDEPTDAAPDVTKPSASGAPVGPGAQNAATPSPAMQAATPLPHVVIVEDDPSLRELMAYALETLGLRHWGFGSGTEALEALSGLATGFGPGPLLLLDVDLPGLDGYALYERLRALRPGVFRAVFISVHANEAAQLRSLGSGALDHIAKPCNLRVLMAKIPVWLQLLGVPTGARP